MNDRLTPSRAEGRAPLVSALKDPKDKVRGFEAGAVDFITKPVQADDVIAQVNTHLTIQRLLRRQVQPAAAAASHGPSEDDATGAPVLKARIFDGADEGTQLGRGRQ